MLNTDTAGYLYAINPDGTPKWRLDLPMLPSSTAPAVAPDGTIYEAPIVATVLSTPSV
jgi:outer membrane protein assembly factor BamB